VCFMSCKRHAKRSAFQAESRCGPANRRVSFPHASALIWLIATVVISVSSLSGCRNDEPSRHTNTDSSSSSTTASTRSDLRAVADTAGPPTDMSRRDFNASCMTAGCHQQLGTTRWVHGPVAVGECAVCHESIGSPEQHEFKPTEPDASTCVTCHAPQEQAAFQHEPFALGTCTDCHNPHGGQNKNFTIAQTAESLCVTCHDAVSVKVTHNPVSGGDCLTCHEAHESEHEHLLVRSQDELCFACHKDNGSLILTGVPSDDRPAVIHEALIEDGCLACHDPHGSDEPSLLGESPRSLCLNCHEQILSDLPLAESLHGAFEGENACTMCHTPHASAYDGLLIDDSCQLCFRCHSEPILSAAGTMIPSMEALIEDSPVVHEPAEYGECTTCHRPHFSAERSLLREHYPELDYAPFDPGAYALCIECHDPGLVEKEFTTETSFREGDWNLHFVHVNREKGRSCGICHQPHAGQLPHLMRATFPFGPGDWDMPIGYVETETGGSCLSACHEQRSYQNDYSFLLFPGSP
jgi:predicted CXXCH cytochrome family protein